MTKAKTHVHVRLYSQNTKGHLTIINSKIQQSFKG